MWTKSVSDRDVGVDVEVARTVGRGRERSSYR